MSLPFLFTFILSLVSSGKNQGVDGQLGANVRNSKRTGVWPTVDTVHRSTITRARAKLNWQLFEEVFYRAVALAYKLFPSRSEYLWEGMGVIAFDGSKYQLPSSKEVRNYVDPESGLDKGNNGRGHYPHCLVSTAYDVFRRMPIARTIVPYNKANERDEATTLIEKIPSGNVLLFDRGYPSYEFILHLERHYEGFYVIRCPASSSFPAIADFMRGEAKEAIIDIKASRNYRTTRGEKAWRQAPNIRLRVIKLISPDGTESVLVTNLFSKKKFSQDKIIELYFKRWSVETHYHDEKVSFEVETFHSKSVNGVMQEMFAVLITAVIAKTLSAVACKPKVGDKTISEPQFKHAVMTVSAESSIFYAENKSKAKLILQEIITEMRRVKYHRPIVPKASKPRVSMQPVNRWCEDKQQRMKAHS